MVYYCVAKSGKVEKKRCRQNRCAQSQARAYLVRFVVGQFQRAFLPRQRHLPNLSQRELHAGVGDGATRAAIWRGKYARHADRRGSESHADVRSWIQRIS